MTDLKMYEIEENLYNKGINYIAGIDEAGRGPLAGPLFVAAVILKKDAKFKYVNDSKKLTAKKRELALEEIKANSLAIQIGISAVEEIDLINIYRATKQTMESVIKNLKIKPDYVLIDQMPLYLEIPHESIVKGDEKSISIACASIVAKTARDEYMLEMDKLFPNYGFKDHKGYATKKHLEALEKHGPTPIHRKSYEPVKSLVKKYIFK